MDVRKIIKEELIAHEARMILKIAGLMRDGVSPSSYPGMDQVKVPWHDEKWSVTFNNIKSKDIEEIPQDTPVKITTTSGGFEVTHVDIGSKSEYRVVGRSPNDFTKIPSRMMAMGVYKMEDTGQWYVKDSDGSNHPLVEENGWLVDRRNS